MTNVSTESNKNKNNNFSFSASEKNNSDFVMNNPNNNSNFNNYNNNIHTSNLSNFAKYSNFISYPKKVNDSITRNILTEDEDNNYKNIFTFSKQQDTQTFKGSFSARNGNFSKFIKNLDGNELKIKSDELRALRNQISSMNEEEIKKISDEYIQELKELAKTVINTFN